MNPWKDIASYDYRDASYYKGREEDIVKFRRLLVDGTTSVVYSDSGIGKTSFLSAGISPYMVEQGYCPIRIVFPDDAFHSIDIEKWLIQYLSKWNDNEVFPGKKEYHPQYAATEENEELAKIYQSTDQCLWWVFHTWTLKVGDATLKPYFIFDQFEDIFVKSENFGEKDFLKNFFSVIEEACSPVIPNKLLPELQQLAQQGVQFNLDGQSNFRITFSLRKEYLSLFDYWTNDQYSLPDLLKNRLLLLPLTRLQAERVMLEQPANEDNTDIDSPRELFFAKVADNILDIVDSKKRDIVEPFILSILCSRLYEKGQKMGRQMLTVNDLEGINIDDLLSGFYNEAVSNIFSNNKHNVQTLEEALVDCESDNSRGIRKRIRANEKQLQSIGFEERFLVPLKDAHIIRSYNINDEIYVELIHDRLADIIAERMRRRKRQKRNSMLLFTSLILALICLLTWFVVVLGSPRTMKIKGPLVEKRLTYRTSYIIPDGVLFLDYKDTVLDNAFRGDTTLTELHIGDCNNIHGGAFNDCNNLTTIYLDGVLSEINPYAFSNCKNIQRVIVSDTCMLNDSVKIIFPPNCYIYTGANRYFHAYNNYYGNSILCYKPRPFHSGTDSVHNSYVDFTTTKIDSLFKATFLPNIHHIRLTKAEEITGVKYRYNIKSVVLPNIRILGDSIFWNSRLTELYFPNLEIVGIRCFNSWARSLYAPKLRIIGEMAFSHSSLRTIDLEAADFISDKAFSNCHNLTCALLKNAKFVGREAFCGCKNLRMVDIGSADSIGANVFGECTELDTIVASPSVADMIINNSSYYFGKNRIYKRKDFKKYSLLTLKNITYGDPGVVGCEDQVYSMTIPKSIPIDYSFSDSLSRYTRLHKVRMKPRSDGYFSFKNGVYRIDIGHPSYSVCFAQNPDECVIMRGSGYNINKLSRRIICFEPTNFTNHIIKEDSKKYTLVVPFGMMPMAKNNSSLDSNTFHITQMSLLQTAWIKAQFNFVEYGARVRCLWEVYKVFWLFLLSVVIFMYFQSYFIFRRRLNFNVGKSLRYCLIWIILTIPMILIYPSILDIANSYDIHPFLPVFVMFIPYGIHLLKLYTKVGYKVDYKRLTIFSILILVIIVIYTIVSNIFDGIQSQIAIFGCFLLLMAPDCVKKRKFSEKKHYIRYFFHADTKYAQQVREWLLASGIPENDIEMWVPSMSQEYDKLVIEQSEHTYLILSSISAEEERGALSDMEQIVPQMLKKAKHFVVPLLIDSESIKDAQLPVSTQKALARAKNWSYCSPVLYHCKLNDAELEAEIKKWSHCKFNKKAYWNVVKKVFLFYLVIYGVILGVLWLAGAFE